MKLGKWTIYFYNPFNKHGRDERMIGIQGYKDWHHSFEYDMRFSVFKRPHLTICAAYTKIRTMEYVVRFYTIASKAYRHCHGGLKLYWKDIYRQGIDEGRDCAG